MNTLNISILAIRIIAIYIIVQGILVLPAITQIFSSISSRTFSVFERFFLGSSILAPLLIGIVCLFFSRKIGSWLSPGKSSDEAANKVDLNELQSVAFSILGILAIVNSLPIFVRTLVARGNQSLQYLKQIGLWQEPHLVASALTLAIGLFLFFGSKFVVRLYLWSKYLGHKTDTKS